MRLLRCLPLFLVSLPAAAGTSIDSYLGAIGGVEIAGEVEVPLLIQPATGAVPSVQATVGDQSEVFSLSSSDFVMTVTDDFVARHELEAKTKKDKRVGEVQYVVIPKIDVGGLVLTDVTALVSSSAVSGVAETQPQQLGLGLLTEAGWAIVPSAGVVRFVPLSAAGALVEKVGGAKAEYVVYDGDVAKIGKDKQRLHRRSLLVPLAAGDLSTRGVLDTGATDTQLREVASRQDLTAAIGGPSHQDGDVVVSWAPLSPAGAAVSTRWVRSITTPDLAPIDLVPNSVVGANVLASYDLAVDPSTRTLALAPVEASKRTNAAPLLLEAAEARAAAADAKAAEAAKESGEPAKPAAAAWTTVATLRAQVGDAAGAIDAWGKVIEADDAACAAHHGLGNAHVLAGDLDAAAASLGAASALYHAWWDDDIVVPGSVEGEGHPAAVPMKMRATYERVPTKNRKGQWIPALARGYWEAQKADGDDLPEGVVPQPASCWTADSDLAGVALAQGDGERAVALYKAWMDRYPPLRMVLDPKLAQVSANALLVGGDHGAARGPLRMAAQFDFDKADFRWVLGLALTYVDQGRLDSAAPLFLQALELAQDDTVAMALYLDAVKADGGGNAAWKAAKEWAEGHPDYPNAAYGLAYAARGTVAAREAKAAEMAVEILAARELRAPFSAGLHAAAARTHLALGNPVKAKKAAAVALKLDAASPAALLADAELLAADGKGPKSRGRVKLAAQIAVDHPGYQLLKTDFAVKAPAPAPAPEGGDDAAPEDGAEGEEKGEDKGDKGEKKGE